MRLVLRRAAKRDLFEARRGYDAIGLMVRHAGTDTGRVPLTN